MSYYFNKVLQNCSFEEAIEHVTNELKKEGFGVLTTIDVQKTFKNKIDIGFKKYTILGACSPHFAHKALVAEDKLGVFLPCNFIIEEHENGTIEVAAVDPIASMSAVKNETLGELALEIQQQIQAVINNL